MASSQNDPLHAVDLSNPSDPTVRTAASRSPSGSVQHAVYVPAAESTVLRTAYDIAIKRYPYTSYLHPLDDGLILSVKNTTNEYEETVGLEVSVHDVAEASQSRRQSTWSIPGGRHHIDRDHRSFLWWAPESVAVMRVTAGWSGAIVLRVRDGDIEEMARIVHLPDTPDLAQTDCRRLAEADVVSDEELTGMEPHALADTVAAAISEHNYVPDLVWVALACGPDEWGMTGLTCYDESRNNLVRAELRSRFVLAVDEELLLCSIRSDSRRWVARAMIIDEELWTLSYDWIGNYKNPQLQVTDLGTWEHLAAVYL